MGESLKFSQLTHHDCLEYYPGTVRPPTALLPATRPPPTALLPATQPPHTALLLAIPPPLHTLVVRHMVVVATVADVHLEVLHIPPHILLGVLLELILIPL